MQHRLHSGPRSNLSFIGTGVRLEGSLLFSGKFLVAGELRGELHGDGELEIAQTGMAEGEIHTNELVNSGRTKGSILVANRVEFKAGCHHQGRVAAPKILIDPEAKFEGKLIMPDAAPTPVPSPWISKKRLQIAAGLVLFLAAGIATTAISRESPDYLHNIWKRLDVIWEARVAEWLKPGEPKNMKLRVEELQRRYISEAALLESKGEFENAAVSLRKALTLKGSRQNVARYRLAKILAQQNHASKAIREVQSLLQRTPGHIEGMILLGDLYVRSGQLSKALEIYREAYLREPEDIVLKRRLQLVEARVRSVRPESAKPAEEAPDPTQVLINAERFISSKDPARAVNLLRGAIEKAPDNARFHFLLGAALVQMNRRSEAIRAYEKVVSLSPDWLDGYIRLGALLESNGRDKDAIALYQRATGFDSNDIEMKIRIAKLHRSRERNKTAQKILLDLLKENPRSSRVLVELGVFLWETGQTEESKKMFFQVLEIDKDSAPALNRLAWFHRRDKESLDHAIKLSKRSLEIQPDTPAYLDTLAELYYRNGESVKALPLIQRAIELDPGSRYFRLQLEKFKRASRK
ncbi:MAG: tetratricopeptide repeat protein [Nitrospinae bacterium]|nr:tetratricopeptide repeat protein [Nitrospinota bacterium]